MVLKLRGRHELDVRRVIVPQGDTAAVWCAFGAASADILHVSERVHIMASPFDTDRINPILADLENRGARQLSDEGVASGVHPYTVDVRSYQRYDQAAGVFASLDAPGCAKLYGILEPLLAKIVSGGVKTED